MNLKARVLKVVHNTAKSGNLYSTIWAIVDGCDLPGRLFANGHVAYKKGDEIPITIEPSFNGNLEVKVVQ